MKSLFRVQIANPLAFLQYHFTPLLKKLQFFNNFKHPPTCIYRENLQLIIRIDNNLVTITDRQMRFIAGRVLRFRSVGNAQQYASIFSRSLQSTNLGKIR